MAKSHLHPYMKPLVPGYATKSFLSESKIILNYLRKIFLDKMKPFEDDYWVFINHKRIPLKDRDQWHPKLYICVTPKDYWKVIGQLIPLGRAVRFNWKFCKDPKLFSRPDKIIIYCTDVAEVKKILKLIRPLLSGMKSHKLFYACNTLENKLEKKEKGKKEFKGIYVGADPNFIKNASWRYYRWAVEQAIIKPNLKNGKLDSHTQAALKALNITLEHYGPRTLTPPKKYKAFVKKVWKEINN